MPMRVSLMGLGGSRFGSWRCGSGGSGRRLFAPSSTITDDESLILLITHVRNLPSVHHKMQDGTLPQALRVRKAAGPVEGEEKLS